MMIGQKHGHQWVGHFLSYGYSANLDNLLRIYSRDLNEILQECSLGDYQISSAPVDWSKNHEPLVLIFVLTDKSREIKLLQGINSKVNENAYNFLFYFT